MISAPVVPHNPTAASAPFTVLIADDDRINRMVLYSMLKKDGHTVYMAENGQEAVTLFEQYQPDLVLVDVMMPGMDGYAATSRITQDCVPEQVFGMICAGLAALHAGGPQRDDLTLIEITCDAGLAHHTSSETAPSAVAKAPACWHMALELDAITLRTLDPLPQIMQMLMALQGLHAHRARLYTILAELFANALEHGLLGLDSGLKHMPQGFVAYCTAREQRLAALEHGWINIALTHTATGTAGHLTVRIEDSGPGFDYQRCPVDLAANTTPSGRGIPLVRALCQALTYHGAGNCAEAVYVWSQGETYVAQRAS